MELVGFKFEQKSFQFFLFSFLRVRFVRTQALWYTRKSVMAPVRRNDLKSKDLFLTESVQVEFHHSGEKGSLVITYLFDVLNKIIVNSN